MNWKLFWCYLFHRPWTFTIQRDSAYRWYPMTICGVCNERRGPQ
jgi:hypothetical protein